MPDIFSVRSLDPGQIGQAFALVSIVDPRLEEAQWRGYADAVLGFSNGAGRTGILTTQSDKGYIFALSVYWIKPDLREGTILDIENFAVADILGNLGPARILLDGLEDLARARGCSCITVSLLNPHMRRWLRARGSPGLELFRTAGFKGEQLRLRKCFGSTETNH